MHKAKINSSEVEGLENTSFSSEHHLFYQHLISPSIIPKSSSVHKFKITSHKYDFSWIHLDNSFLHSSCNGTSSLCILDLFSLSVRPSVELARMLVNGHSDNVWMWWEDEWVEVKMGKDKKGKDGSNEFTKKKKNGKISWKEPSFICNFSLLNQLLLQYNSF